MNEILRRNSVAISLFVFTAALFCAVVFGRDFSGGFIKGVYFCFEALMPSVFPFMIISSFSVKSGVNTILGKLIDTPSGKLFGISGMSAAAVLTGILGGYPVAAGGIASLYENGIISAAEARKCALSAVCAGPGFLICFVGDKLLQSAEIGAALFAAQVSSVIILLFINRFVFKTEAYNSSTEIKNLSLSEAFIDSVTDSAYASIKMCAMVVVFSAVTEVLGNAPFIGIILEVSNACNILSENKEILPLAFSIGFGGICVHFQIFQALNKIRINKGLFFLYRIIQGLLTLGITFVFIKVFNLSSPVFSSIKSPPGLGLSTSVTGSILLIITGASLIYNISKGG